MKIFVNGKEAVLGKELTVAQLLGEMNVEMQEYVTVQINDEFIDKAEFDQVAVKENDVIEFLYFMGGGAI